MARLAAIAGGMVALALAAAPAGCGDNGDTAFDAAPPDAGGLTCLAGGAPGDVLDGAWDPRFTIAGVTGSEANPPAINDFARDVDGSLVAAGRFRWFSGAAAMPLLRWRNGAWEPARTSWEFTPPPGGFDAIAIGGDGALALAAAQSSSGRTEIWVDSGDGLGIVGDLNGRVRAMAWFDGKLWVGGWLNMIDVGSWLVVWDGTSWSPPPGGEADLPVSELTVAGNELLVGGAFNVIGGITSHEVATYDGTTWTAYDLPTGTAVFGLGRDASGVLYAGGAVTDRFFGPPVGGLVRWTGSAWELVGGGLGRTFDIGVVTDLAIHDGVVDVIGCFDTAGGDKTDPAAVRTANVARWDGAAWHALDADDAPAFVPWFVSPVCGDENLTTITDAVHTRVAFDGARLVVGGGFGGHGGVLSPGLVALDGKEWVAQGSSGLGLGGAVSRVAAHPERCEAYGLGELSHAGGAAARTRLVRFDGDHWDPLEAPLPDDAFCGGMAMSRTGALVLACSHSEVGGGLQVHRLWRLEGDTLVQLSLDLPGTVNQLSFDPNGSLWIAGGNFVGGYLARLDGNFLTIVEDRFDNAVFQVDARSPADVIIGGAFTRIGNVGAAHIARYDGVEWLPLGAGVPGPVVALARDDRFIYASSVDEGFGHLLLGAFDGSWVELATPDAGIPESSFFTIEQLVPLDGGLLIAGNIALDDGNLPAPLYYRDGRFHSLGGGIHGATTNNSVGLGADAVLVGGFVNEVGTIETRLPSVGVARWKRR